MKLSLEGLRASGGFSGAPVKREIVWRDESGEKAVYDVYVRRLSFHTAVTDVLAAVGYGNMAAGRIANSICTEHGAPIFTPYDVTGIDENGKPILVRDDEGNPVQAADDEGKPLFNDKGEPIFVERGALDDDLTKSLLDVIGEVNGLGKPKLQTSQGKTKSGTNSSSAGSGEKRLRRRKPQSP